MRLANKMKMLTAMTAAALLALSGCGSSGGASGGSSNSVASSGDGMVIGALLPLTGTLAYLAPPEVAAIKLAISDINKAGGVLGKDVTEVEADTSDGEHADQNTSAAQSVLSKHPSVVIGPAASGVVKNVYKSIVAEKIPVISMASTSMTLSGMDPYFFRTVAPDAVQGAVMGDLIAQDGVKKLAIACFNDEYGTGMRDIILQKLKDAGVDVVYGEKDAFDPAETNYSSIATAIKNSGADATLIISYDQATPLIKALASAGVDTHKLYLVDGNTVDYSKTYDAGLLKGSKGTIPGTHVDDKFKSDLKGTGTDISDTTYAAETYDAVILAALAAEQGGSTSGETVAKNLSSVSGADGGEKCESFEACKALIKDKKKIQYFGKTGIGPFNKNNDPSSANIGIFEYDGNNVNVFQDMQSGDVPPECLTIPLLYTKGCPQGGPSLFLRVGRRPQRRVVARSCSVTGMIVMLASPSVASGRCGEDSIPCSTHAAMVCAICLKSWATVVSGMPAQSAASVPS